MTHTVAPWLVSDGVRSGGRVFELRFLPCGEQNTCRFCYQVLGGTWQGVCVADERLITWGEFAHLGIFSGSTRLRVLS